MNARIWTIATIIVSFVRTGATAQECSTALDRAGKSYEQGSLRDVIETLTPCLQSGMSPEDQWQGYRLVALAHLFLDEPDEADTAIGRMLAINPRYQPNPGRDPIEFLRPLEDYGSYPRIYAGVKGGLNRTGREITRQFSVVGHDAALNDNAFTLGSDIGVMLDVNIAPRLAVATEALYSSRTFSQTSRALFTIDRTYTEHLTFLTIPLLLKYRIGDWSVEPYLYGGYFAGLLLGASSDLEATLVSAGPDTLELPTGTSRAFSDNGIRSTQDRRNGVNHGITGGAGLVYKLGAGALVVDARYCHGLAPIVKAQGRYAEQGTVFQYLYVDDDFRLRDFSLSIGYVFQMSFTTYRK